jgi:thymidylate synthase ThyX
MASQVYQRNAGVAQSKWSKSMKITFLPKEYVGEVELQAMLQAFYSRSDQPIADRLAEMSEHTGSIEKIKDSLKKYLLNYGHKSIGDCASLTVFFEGVSMAAAKAIQDSPLYNGQECSTRYINYENVRFAELDTPTEQVQILYEGAQYQSGVLYKLTYDAVTRHMREVLEYNGYDLDSKVLQNAIHAKACDYARGFLLIGSLTQVAWTTTIRQFGDRLNVLEQHPIPEVRKLSNQLRQDLHDMYPSSFKNVSYLNVQEYNRKWAEHTNYLTPSFPYVKPWNTVSGRVLVDIDEGYEQLASQMMRNGRMAQVEASAALNSMGTVKATFVMDYGSFRDLQRHRSANVRHSMARGALQLNEFYLYPYQNWMDKEEKAQFRTALDKMREIIEQVPEHVDAVDAAEAQYFYPMAQDIHVTMRMGLASAAYIAEIRSGRAVHPTARWCAHMLAAEMDQQRLKLFVESWQDIYGDSDANPPPYNHDEIYVARGLQTFKKDL